MLQELEIWQSLSKFRSSSFTQRFLTNCYEQKQINHPDKLAYQNCFPFIYYLDYSEKYFKQVNHSPMELHPILLFYGMVQLLKACILTQDPKYPSTSQVLAHGVSTRKRKKAHYIFLEDEVKLQKNGLLTHFSDKMFHVKHFPGEKYKMRQLLRQISELHSLFSMIENKKNKHKLFQQTPTTFCVHKKILDDYQLGVTSFTNYLCSRAAIENITEQNDGFIIIKLKRPLKPYHCSPFLYDLNNSYYLSADREELINVPEVIIHYLLLYNLSMICRYETEWWGDLHQYNSESDFPFIETFLIIAKIKVPKLLFSFLNEQIESYP